MVRRVALSAGLLVAAALGSTGPAHAAGQSCASCAQAYQTCLHNDRAIECVIEYQMCVGNQTCPSPNSARNSPRLALIPTKPLISPAVPRDEHLVAMAELKGP